MDDDRYTEEAIRRLWDVLDMVNHEVVSTQALIDDVTSDLRNASEGIITVIGGSSQRVDQDMVESLDLAIGRSDLALDALDWVRASIRRLG